MSNFDSDRFWELLNILTIENPDPEALAQAQQIVYDFRNIPFLIEVLRQPDDPKHALLAKYVLRKIVKSPRDLFQIDFCQFMRNLSDEDYDQFIQLCLGMMNISLEYVDFFSKIIFKCLFAKLSPNTELYYSNLRTVLTTLVPQIAGESPKEIIEVVAKLFKRLLKSYLPEEIRQEYYHYLNAILAESMSKSQNLYLTTLLVKAYIKAHMAGSDFLFQEGQYGHVLIQFLSQPEIIMQLSPNPYFFQFLETNCTFLLKYTDYFSFALDDPAASGELISPIINLIPGFIALLYGEFPDNPSNETMAQSLIAIIDNFFDLLLSSGIFNDENNFNTIINLAFQFAHPSQYEIQEFHENLRNYYISVFLDSKSLFQSAVSIFEKICKTKNFTFIQCILELILPKQSESSLFIISKIYPFFRDHLNKHPKEKQTILTAIKAYVKNWFNEYVKLEPRMKYSVLMALVNCVDLLDPDDYPALMEIIGGLLGSSVQTDQNGQLQPANSTPEICVDFTFASDLSCNFVQYCQESLPDEFINVIMWCFINCYSNSALDLLKNVIKTSPDRFMEHQIAFIQTCLAVVQTGFEQHQTPDEKLAEIDASIYEYHLSFIEFISSYHSDNYPTEALLQMFETCINSEPFTSSEFVCVLSNIAKNVIQACQPDSEKVLSFILQNYNIETFHCFENEFCQPIMQSLISFPSEVIATFVDPIYDVIKENIIGWIFPRISEIIKDSLSGDIQYFNQRQQEIMTDAVDYSATFSILARWIQLLKDDLEAERIAEIFDIINRLYAFQFFNPVAEGSILPIQPCIDMIFYEVLASLCLCANFDFSCIINFLKEWGMLIASGYIDSLYLRRLHYTALSKIMSYPAFQSPNNRQKFGALLQILINNTYNGNEASATFLEVNNYFATDRDIPAPVELNESLPEFVVDEENDEEDDEDE